MLTKKQFTQKIAKRIREVRELKKLSQEELAHEAGLYRTYVHHVEKGRYSPSGYVLYKLSVALKVPLGDIFR